MCSKALSQTPHNAKSNSSSYPILISSSSLIISAWPQRFRANNEVTMVEFRQTCLFGYARPDTTATLSLGPQAPAQADLRLVGRLTFVDAESAGRSATKGPFKESREHHMAFPPRTGRRACRAELKHQRPFFFNHRCAEKTISGTHHEKGLIFSQKGVCRSVCLPLQGSKCCPVPC